MSLEQAIVALTAELAAIRTAVEYLALDAKLRRVHLARMHGERRDGAALAELENTEARVLVSMAARADDMPGGRVGA